MCLCARLTNFNIILKICFEWHHDIRCLTWQVYGPESSGKTTLALHAIAEVQKLGGNAMLVDSGHAFDPAYSKALGVDVENLIGAIGMQQMGLQARLMSQALRKMSGNASKAGCTLIFLNQIRYKIGVYYGNPEVSSGGIALKFFASVRLEIRPTGKIIKGDEDTGLRVRVRVQTTKVSRPYKQAEFEIIIGEGGCILDCADMMDVVAKKGSWYSYGDSSLGQGRDKVLQYLRDNPILCDEIEKVRACHCLLNMKKCTKRYDGIELIGFYHKVKYSTAAEIVCRGTRISVPHFAFAYQIRG
ncbi:DNA repair protein recA-like protein 1 [Hibiscus syriacus]|uniref:DNA repair protein recA-like protein 1 n=1 Tax=Hibiscus syriacus TaxID=106335 RepID=A0A6A3APP2_HIBSY|nr:DNA repair protein recA-like protein 1 [Hibiscus syriacus]